MESAIFNATSKTSRQCSLEVRLYPTSAVRLGLESCNFPTHTGLEQTSMQNVPFLGKVQKGTKSLLIEPRKHVWGDSRI